MRIILRGVLLFLVMVIPAEADLINVLTETHHIVSSGPSGSFGEFHEFTSSSPLSYTAIYPDCYTGPCSSFQKAGGYSVYAGSYSPEVNAYSESTYTFTSDVDLLVMDYLGIATSWTKWDYGTAKILLANVSTGEVLLDLLIQDTYSDTTTILDRGYVGSSIAFMPGNSQYELFMGAYAFQGSNGGTLDALVDVGFRTTPAPEPATTLLIGIGIIGILVSKFKRKNYKA
jgi:hypothetical protein